MHIIVKSIDKIRELAASSKLTYKAEKSKTNLQNRKIALNPSGLAYRQHIKMKIEKKENKHANDLYISKPI
jgi:hypothetical protein